MKKLLVGLWLALTAFSASAQDVARSFPASGQDGARSFPASGQDGARCFTNPESCLTAPIAKSCPAGQKWSTAGSRIAHCVNVDPVCPASEKVAHDFLGNPSCVARCSAGEYWNGASCSPCTTTSTASGSCQAGYNGTAYRTVTTNSCAGSTTYGSWDYSNCTVACTQSTSTESGSCQAGYTGTAYRSVTNNSCSGTTYGSWDYSNCTQSCGTSSYNESGSCPANYTGSAYRTVTKNDCTGALTYGSWNTTNCTYSPACPAGTAWNGSQCVATGPTCDSTTDIVVTGSRTCAKANFEEHVEMQWWTYCRYPDGSTTNTYDYTSDYGIRNCRSGGIVWK